MRAILIMITLGGKKIPYIFIHTCKANKKAIDVKSVFTKVNKLQIPLTP